MSMIVSLLSLSTLNSRTIHRRNLNLAPSLEEGGNLSDLLTVLVACSVGMPLNTDNSERFFGNPATSGKPITSVIEVGRTVRESGLSWIRRLKNKYMKWGSLEFMTKSELRRHQWTRFIWGQESNVMIATALQHPYNFPHQFKWNKTHRCRLRKNMKGIVSASRNLLHRWAVQLKIKKWNNYGLHRAIEPSGRECWAKITELPI